MKKILLSLLALVLVLGGLAYQNQTALMLALVKYKSANEYEVGPPRDIPWSAGPTPSGMAPVVSRISADMDSVLPPAIYDAELDASSPPY